MNIEDPLSDNNKTQSPKYFSDFYTDSKARALLSYSFHTPWASTWSTNTRPSFVIGADENNGKNPITANTSVSAPNTDQNSQNHNSDGQNVLKIDASVSFEKNVFCGLSDDNIYSSNRVSSSTTSNDTSATGSIPGYLKVTPSSKFLKDDSVLLPVSHDAMAGTTPAFTGGSWDRKLWQ